MHATAQQRHGLLLCTFLVFITWYGRLEFQSTGVCILWWLQGRASGGQGSAGSKQWSGLGEWYTGSQPAKETWINQSQRIVISRGQGHGMHVDGSPTRETSSILLYSACASMTCKDSMTLMIDCRCDQSRACSSISRQTYKAGPTLS